MFCNIFKERSNIFELQLQYTDNSWCKIRISMKLVYHFQTLKRKSFLIWSQNKTEHDAWHIDILAKM